MHATTCTWRHHMHFERRAPEALAGRRGPVTKHVPDVALAAVAAHLRAAGSRTLSPLHSCTPAPLLKQEFAFGTAPT